MSSEEDLIDDRVCGAATTEDASSRRGSNTSRGGFQRTTLVLKQAELARARPWFHPTAQNSASATPWARSAALPLARASMGEHELLLDPAIRNWVLIPIVIIMFLMGLLRNNVTKMMRKDTVPKREQIKINNQLMRCRRLRANGHYLPPNAFHARKGFFCEKEKGVLMVKQVPSPLLRLLLRRRRRLLCRRPPPSPPPLALSARR